MSLLGLRCALVFLLAPSLGDFQDDLGERIRKLTQLLRSDDIQERDTASRELKALGKASIPSLEDLRNDKDSEVALRARLLINSILYGFPKLVGSRTLILPGEQPLAVLPSSTGRFLVLMNAKTLGIYQTKTMVLVKELRMFCSAIRFDDTDKELVVVGEVLARFETEEWKEMFRARLPDAAMERPGQALILPGHIAYYRTSGGGLTRAEFLGDRLTTERQESSSEFGDESIGEIFTTGWDESLLVHLEKSKRAALWFRGKVYTLAPADQVVAGTYMVSRVVMVGKRRIISYSNRFKILASYPDATVELDEATLKPNTSAAFDSAKGVVFILREHQLRGRSVVSPSEEHVYETMPKDLSGLAVDSLSRVLYAFSNGKLLSWDLKD